MTPEEAAWLRGEGKGRRELWGSRGQGREGKEASVVAAVVADHQGGLLDGRSREFPALTAAKSTSR